MDNLRKFFFIIPRSYYIKIFILIIVLFIGIFFELLSIAIIFPVIGVLSNTLSLNDIFFGQYLIKAIPSSAENFNLLILIFLVIIFIIKNLYLLFLIWYQQNFSLGILQKISSRLLKNYLYADYKFHLKKNSSELMRNVMGETSIFNKKILTPVIFIVMDMLIFLGIILLAFSIEFKITSILIFCSITILFLFIFFSKKKLYQLGLQRQLYGKYMLQSAQDAFQGIKLIKIFSKENYFKNKYIYNLLKNLTADKKQTIIVSIPKLLTEIIAIISFSIIIYLLLKNTENFVDAVPKLSLYVVAAFRIIPCVNRITLNLQTLRYSKSTLNNLHKEMKEVKYKETDLKLKKVANFSNQIKFNNVFFAYNQNNPEILKNINVSIKKGSTIGFIGKTGEGKSTFLDLITGLLKPTKGEIFLDNTNILNIPDYKHIIGYVPQNLFLLDGSILQNIIFSLDEKIDVDKKNLQYALETSKTINFINQLPNKLDTLIGERGVRLSGGQQQRISIARALYTNPEVLILDESTNALDVKTEEQIMKDLYSLKGLKTILIVSHRESALENCDEIYEISRSEIKKIN